MAENTKIEWADHTFNPWEGCTKVGPGCDNCYAEARNARFAGGSAINWGPGAPRRRTSAANWRNPLAWDKAHAEFFAQHGRRQRVFCASLADVFGNEVDPQWRIDLMSLILATPNLDWLLLTKRIGNAAAMLETAFRAVHAGREAWKNNVPPNVWIGATVVNQAEADRDVPKLLAVPAARRFLSIEPMLGEINLEKIHQTSGYGCSPCSACGTQVYINSMTAESYCNSGCDGPSWPKLDWVICGGESGPNARPMHPEWVRSLRDQCAAAGVPFAWWR